MANAKELNLYFFNIDNVDDDFPITNPKKAQELVNRGFELFAFGNVLGTKGTTRTSVIKKITFDHNQTHIVTQNSDYIVVKKKKN